MGWRGVGFGWRAAAVLLAVLAWAAAGSSAGEPAPARSGRPNVLFIISDDLNTALGCYGDPLARTPNIDRLARRGLRFERAYCQYPLCNPSRASLLSGLRAESTGVTGNGHRPRAMMKTAVFLPQHFRNQGYFTARVGKLFHHPSIFGGKPGEDLDDPACWDVSERGTTPGDPDGYGGAYASTREEDDPEREREILRQRCIQPRSRPVADYWLEWSILNTPEAETSEAIVARRAAELMRKAKAAGKPFFIAAGFRKPHLLWTAPRRYFDMHSAGRVPPLSEPPAHLQGIPQVALTYKPTDRPLSDTERREAVAAYYACVSFMDAQVGVLLDHLDRLKAWEDTVVVFTSDHGWHLGEHGGMWGKVSLFEASARVPMIVAAPGKVRGKSSPRLAELVDLYPTLSDLCGLRPAAGLEGESLVPLLEDPRRRWKRGAFSVLRKSGQFGRSVRTERYRYTEWPDGSAQLYDYRRDPHEWRNLAEAPEHRKLRADLKSLLAGGWKAARPPL